VVTEAGRFYIGTKFRHRVISDRIFESWSFPVVVETSEIAVSKYPIVKSLGFRDGSLVKDIMTGGLYVISRGERRRITSPDVLDRLGKTEADFMLASQKELSLHKEGEVLN
jgi:hypothetical protein